MELLKINFLDRYPVSPSVEAEWRERQAGSMVGLIAQTQLRGLNQGFIVYGRIRQHGFDSDRLEKMTRTAVVDAFSRGEITHLFRVVDLVVAPFLPLTLGRDAELPVDEQTARRFEEQALRGNAAALCLRKHLLEMQRLAQSWVMPGAVASWSKFGHYLERLQIFREAMALGAQAGWCAQTYAGIQNAFATVKRLADPTEPEYQQHIANIVHWLQVWPVVNRWHSEPPTG